MAGVCDKREREGEVGCQVWRGEAYTVLGDGEEQEEARQARASIQAKTGRRPRKACATCKYMCACDVSAVPSQNAVCGKPAPLPSPLLSCAHPASRSLHHPVTQANLPASCPPRHLPPLPSSSCCRRQHSKRGTPRWGWAARSTATAACRRGRGSRAPGRSSPGSCSCGSG